MYVCLWSPDWSTGEESAVDPERGLPSPDDAAALSELAPRLRVEAERIWADGRGLDAAALAERLLRRLAVRGLAARAGVATVPVAAEMAARWGPCSMERDGATPFLVKERTGFGWRRATVEATVSPELASSGGAVVVVPRGQEAEWMGGFPVVALGPDARVLALLDGVGITTVRDLARLPREAVEVRFGPGAVVLWRLARGDDRRVLFRRIPPARPHGSIDFVDYVLTDPARLIFTANALLGPLCDRLVGRGEHARSIRITLPLADGSEWTRTLRPARPTASREAWLRLIRTLLERLTVPDAVAGMHIELGATEPATVRQGDLFDHGFATAAAVEAAVARLVERQVAPVRPRRSAHPLAERRAEWIPEELEDIARPAPDRATGPLPAAPAADSRGSLRAAALSLQLLAEPKRILVETGACRDHDVPIRFRDRGAWRQLTLAAGPDRISGGQWEEKPFAREYFRCVTEEGAPLWLYRDGFDGQWYLHGIWD